jgi:Rrf2 family protein
MFDRKPLDNPISCNYYSYMKREGRLSVALHVLAHLVEAGDQPTTSEALASHCHTNPVVIRRTLAGLREAGIVASVKGHGGGWTVARSPVAITLGEVYAALGERGDLVPAVDAAPDGCLIEAVVIEALDSYYAEAEALLRRRLDEITLADLAADFQRRFAASPRRMRQPEEPGV